jgi:hypothetical protein
VSRVEPSAARRYEVCLQGWRKIPARVPAMKFATCVITEILQQVDC